MANPWDVGSAVILERLGFAALATTSSGMAFARGKPDGGVTEKHALDHCSAVCAATSLPVSGDLEHGYGDEPDHVAALIQRAAATGLAGCSIEDHTGRHEDPIYPATLALERVHAAAEAARGVDGDFVLTARCERSLWTSSTADEIVSTLQAYAAAGADVVFAPGLDRLADIRMLCDAVHVPVSVGLEMPAPPTIAELTDAGVSRVSVGAVFVRRAYGAMVESASELLGSGALTSASNAIDYDRLESFFDAPPG